MGSEPEFPEFLQLNERDRETFLRELVLELAKTLQSVVGISEAEGFVKIVGLRLGEAIYRDYVSGDENAQPNWSVQDLAAVLIDLKRKIHGGFRVEQCDADQIILVNDRCPFGDAVKGRPSLCQMTSSVFGKIAAESMGQANVRIDESIAQGHARCRVVVRLNTEAVDGTNYYRVG